MNVTHQQRILLLPIRRRGRKPDREQTNARDFPQGLRAGCEARQAQGEGEDEPDGAAVHRGTLQRRYDQSANTRRLGHECSGVEPVGQRETRGSGFHQRKVPGLFGLQTACARPPFHAFLTSPTESILTRIEA
jgi:hypothetical protein